MDWILREFGPETCKVMYFLKYICQLPITIEPNIYFNLLYLSCQVFTNAITLITISPEHLTTFLQYFMILNNTLSDNYW